MGDESNLLLQTILNEQREARRELSEIMKTMVYKEDLKETEDSINRKFEGLQNEFKNHAKTLAAVKAAEDKNTHFRESIFKGAAWVAGAVFVAFLGAITAFLVPHANAIASPMAAPAATATPFNLTH